MMLVFTGRISRHHLLVETGFRSCVGINLGAYSNDWYIWTIAVRHTKLKPYK